MEYSKESEFQLVREILNGDRQKYRHLVDRYAPVVFHVVRRYTNDESVVEDADARIFVDADAFVTSNGEEWNGERVEYTTVEDVDGTIYRIVTEVDSGGPFRECLGRSEDV